MEVPLGSQYDLSTAKLEYWVVGALSPYSSQRVVVPLISVSRWSPYASVQICSFGCSRPNPRAFPLYPITSVWGILPLDITFMADSYSTLDCQKVSRKSVLLLLYTAGPQETPPTGVGQEGDLENRWEENLSEGFEENFSKAGSP